MRSAFPNGWWDWFDQSKTLESAAALAHGDLSPVHHWYPLGYAILGAPFIRLWPAHPFVLVDLAALLAAFAAFCRFARNVGVPGHWAAILFAAASLSDRQIFDQWAIPWNTSPAAALTWVLLARITGPPRGARDSMLTGFAAGCIPLFRPTDTVLAAACLGTAIMFDIVGRPARRWPDWLWTIAGAIVPVAAYAFLYLAIYGPHETDYMRQSRALGFTLYDLPWKAYVIFVDPRPWFGDGNGLLRRCPWIALSIAGAVPALLRNRNSAILVAMLAAHAALYLSYVDLLPTGMWRFQNVHYWIWALPGYALLAFMAVQDLSQFRGRRPALAIASLAATAVLLCVHLDPVRVDGPAKMLMFPGIAAKFDDVYFAPVSLRDAGGTLANIYGMRAFPTPSGLAIAALRRPFTGDITWPAPTTGTVVEQALRNAGPPDRWAIGLSLGRPCWIPHSACK